MAVEEMASKRKSVLSEKDGEDSERKVGEKGRQEEEVKENKRGIEGEGGGEGKEIERGRHCDDTRAENKGTNKRLMTNKRQTIKGCSNTRQTHR